MTQNKPLESIFLSLVSFQPLVVRDIDKKNRQEVKKQKKPTLLQSRYNRTEKKV